MDSSNQGPFKAGKIKYRIDLAYDGTRYSGWAIQPNRPSIQGEIENALKTVLRARVPIIGSGRTDAGVHARLQVAHFYCNTFFIPSALCYSLNGVLPRDIRIYSITAVDEPFHARFSVKKKIYRYYFTSIQDPFNYKYSYYVRSPLKQDLLKEAFPLLIGTHDFSGFAASGCRAKNPIKTLYALQMIPQHSGWFLEFEGNGFLYKMVRNITGTLLEIAFMKRPLGDITMILDSKDRTLAGPTAPAHPLFLHAVHY